MERVFVEFAGFCNDITRMLDQLTGAFHKENKGFYCFLIRDLDGCFDVRESSVEGDFLIVSGSGGFSEFVGKSVCDVLSDERCVEMKLAVAKKMNLYYEDYVFVYFKSKKGMESVLYIDMKLDLMHIYTFEVLMECFGFFISNWELKKEMEFSQSEFLCMLGEAAEMRSLETGNHVRRVAEYSMVLARGYGLSADEVKMIYSAAPMHDLGKLGVGDAVLNKPGKLSPEEFERMKEHCIIGYEMLDRLQQPVMKVAADIALTHHERVDGSGYPLGFKGEEIPLLSRIVAVADVFDALGTERVYKTAWSDHDIMEFFKMEKDKGFDGKVVDVLFSVFDEICSVRERYRD